MTIAKLASIALLASAAAWSSAALAQTAADVPPEITAKCQAYVEKRVPVGGDQQRQSLMTACVKKAMKASKKKKRG